MLPMMAMSPLGRTSSHPHTIDVTTRRRTRKGTRSCWECKRRKMRCTFDSDVHGAVCTSCRRRGSQCLSQEFPEEVRIEPDLLAGRQHGNRGPNHGALASSSSTPALPALHTPLTPVSVSSEHTPLSGSHRFEILSRELHAKLPSAEDTVRIIHLVPQPPAFLHEMMTMPYTWPFRDQSKQPSHLLDVPTAETHPVLIARHMILLASMLLHLDHETHAGFEDLSVPPSVMSAGLIDLAASRITTNDDLLGSIESIDCIVMESVYHANLGNLRRSWLVARKAVSLGQLMGLNRSDGRGHYEILDPSAPHNPRLVWSRIIFLDRILCLMLGLPQGCSDLNMSSEALLTASFPMERLERIHSAVASRVLERNELETSNYDRDITRALDQELQKAARSIPSKWWLIPNLGNTNLNPRTKFEETGRIFAQVLHYNLLNQLHLPYMLRSHASGQVNDYSRSACVTSAREILSRFTALRFFNGIASSCRIIDFIALMAALTLLLAHLDLDASSKHFLSHQYHSDRALLEQVQEDFRATDSLCSDQLGLRSTRLVQKLLAIEADDSHGNRRVSVHKADVELAHDNSAVDVHIPYFGVIRLSNAGSGQAALTTQSAGNGVNSWITNPRDKLSNETGWPSRADSVSRAFHHEHPRMAGVEDIRDASDSMLADPQASNTMDTNAPMVASIDSAFQTDSLAAENFADAILQTGQQPGLTAGTEDWAFQGVELAFFDALMKSSTNNRNQVA